MALTNFHIKLTLRVDSAKYTQCIHVGSQAKTTKQRLLTQPFAKIQLYLVHL